MSSSKKAIHFIEHFCSHAKGKLAGEKFQLAQWQKDLLVKFYDTLTPDNQRQYQQVWLELGRKNGKSTLVAALGLFALLGDGGQAEVISAASTRDQAKIIFDSAKTMVLSSEILSRRCKVLRNEIAVPSTNSIYRVISADAKRQHGLNPSFCILDEVHCLGNDELYTALRTAGGSRENFAFWQITTAGTQASFGYSQHSYARKVADGSIKDPTFLPVIYAADQNGDWKDPKQWIKANPNIGISLNQKFLEDSCREAQTSISKEMDFKRYHLNLWEGSAEQNWIQIDKYLKVEKIPKKEMIEKYKNRVCHGGLDLSSKRDLSAFSLYFPPTYGEDVGAFLVWHWCPKYATESRRESIGAQVLDDWIRDDFITEHKTEWINQELIVRDIAALAEEFQIQSIGVDEWNASETLRKLKDDHNVEVLTFRQTLKNLNNPTKVLEEWINFQRVILPDDPVLQWEFSNAVCISDRNGNIAISKSREKDKVDGVMSMIMALGRWQASTATETDFSYLENGITIIGENYEFT